MSSTEPDLAGLVMAGGRSRRFPGEDKVLLDFRGRPMVTHVYDVVNAVASPVLISTRRRDRRVLPVDATFVEDQYADCGPLAGLHAGMRAVSTNWLLAVAADMPFLTPAALRSLTDARAEYVRLVIARDPDDRRHPLCACYHVSLLPLVEKQLAARRLALQAFVEAAEGVREVNLPHSVLRNVNTPDDLTRPRS